MISVRKRVITRLAATVVASLMFVGGGIATAGSAAADETAVGTGGTTAEYAGLTKGQWHYVDVQVEERGKLVWKQYPAGLFTMNVDGGGTIKTYCIDFGTSTVEKARYQETSWGSSVLADRPGDAAKIHWILQNSYPQVDDLNALGRAAGLKGHQKLTQAAAAAATQAAIWRYSDPDHASTAKPRGQAAQKLTDYLYESAGEIAEPRISLDLTPPEVSGKPGEKLGPVVVNTTAGTVSIVPNTSEGVTVTDASGSPVTEAVDGSELYFDVPVDAADGTASFTASATLAAEVGRVFKGIDVVTQTMILAGASEVSTSKTATANWASEAPAPTFSHEVDCVAGGVNLTVGNNGDEPFEFDFQGETHTIPAGGTKDIFVPVENKQEYHIVITGDDEKVLADFRGVLDCEVSPPEEPGEEPNGEEPDESEGETPGEPEGDETENEPNPQGSGDDEVKDESPNLAETGSSSNVGMIAGIAIALLVAGGAAMFFIRKRGASSSS
ncbi:thioester domain-containing protein [Streptomyces alkaliphilus]|uniref:thioester domain-containing protein n=1 Tax=Streptomyces alkaliphilus TaxID=1472722 RepID=UPI00117C27CF|nr:thioester domain-containing protein [Streptomyces alkaliphilus]MQS09732.1 TQXA domain-containing protein [Streptomyces alkaliphilus]